MKKPILLIALLASCFGLRDIQVFGQTTREKKDIRKATIAELIKDFTSDDWMGKVSPAKNELESRQAEVLPDVIRLLVREDRVKLRNTADLIYPGAQTFYGHGWIVDYDVDSISARAGWLLEDLTFQDFGFREGAISEGKLFEAVLSGNRDTKLSNVTGKAKEDEERKKARALAIGKASEWWGKTSRSWSRFETVRRALRGSDTNLQYRVFQWLRNGDTPCEGLTVSTFERLLLPDVKRLAISKNEDIREETQLLLSDHANEKWWYRYKIRRDYPDTYSSMELK